MGHMGEFVNNIPYDQQSPPTLQEWFYSPFSQVITTSAGLGWNNTIAHLSQLSSLNHYIPSPLIDNDTLVMNVSGPTTVDGYVAGAYFKTLNLEGHLNIVPRSIDMFSKWQLPVKAVFIELNRQQVIEIASSITQGDPSQIQIQYQYSAQDPVMEFLVWQIYNELLSQNVLGSLFVDSISNALIIHLLRKYSALGIKFDPIRERKLTPIQIGIINEYIEAHLHLKITLADLAKCVFLSVPHFEKMFRATFNQPPYQYVLQQRITRAKRLLKHDILSLSDVAHDCGFANQSHLTKHFTRLVGISPARFAREQQR